MTRPWNFDIKYGSIYLKGSEEEQNNFLDRVANIQSHLKMGNRKASESIYVRGVEAYEEDFAKNGELTPEELQDHDTREAIKELQKLEKRRKDWFILRQATGQDAFEQWQRDHSVTEDQIVEFREWYESDRSQVTVATTEVSQTKLYQAWLRGYLYGKGLVARSTVIDAAKDCGLVQTKQDIDLLSKAATRGNPNFLSGDTGFWRYPDYTEEPIENQAKVINLFNK